MNTAPSEIEQLRAENQHLRRSEARFLASELRERTLFETVGQGVVYQDADGQIIDANFAAEQILGLSLSQLQGRTSRDPRWQAIHEDGTPFLGEDHPAMVALRTGQEVANVVMGVYHPTDETYHWLRIQAVPQFLLGSTTSAQVAVIFTDITEQWLAAQTLQGEHQQLEAIMEALDEGVIAMRPDGVLVVINRAARQLMLADPDAEPRTVQELATMSQMQLRDPTGVSIPPVDWPLMRVLRGERFSNWELRLRPAGSDEERWAAFGGITIQDVNSAPVLGIVTRRDITQRKHDAAALEAQAEALRTTNAELAHALRLKDEFLAMMSHELRTPLNALLGYTESLAEEIYGPVSARQRTALAAMTHHGQHLLAILSDILDLSDLEAGHAVLDVQPIAIDALCRTVIQIVQAAAQQNAIHLRHTLAADVVGLRADECRLMQILVNLLDNAIKFTPPGGSVGLAISTDAAQEQIAFTVWDTGIGIAEADYARLFQPFTQVDGRLSRQYGGIGLGLTLVRRLVDLHGGSIQMESIPGQGSRFTVRLPWSAADNMMHPEAPAALPAPMRLWATAPRVVIADDHEPTLVFYQERLTQEGCQVTLARTGAEAVAQVRAIRPDVAMLDMQMPDLGGLTAIRQIRADPEVGATPIIALTALAMPGDRERCMEAGANTYLAKPVGIRTLIEAIAEVLAGSEAERSGV